MTNTRTVPTMVGKIGNRRPRCRVAAEAGGFSQPRELDPATLGGPPGQLEHPGNDPAETRNLYDDEPDVRKRLTKLLDTIRNQKG